MTESGSHPSNGMSGVRVCVVRATLLLGSQRERRCLRVDMDFFNDRRYRVGLEVLAPKDWRTRLGTVSVCLLHNGPWRQCVSARTRDSFWQYVVVCGLCSPLQVRYSEEAPHEGTPNQLPSAQPLTFAALEGVKIKIELVTEMPVQSEGFQWSFNTGCGLEHHDRAGRKNRLELPADRSHPRFGDRAGRKFTTSATLDQPWYTPNGEANWQFADGTLVFVRSYKNAGAYRMSIALKQDGQNLACSVAKHVCPRAWQKQHHDEFRHRRSAGDDFQLEDRFVNLRRHSVKTQPGRRLTRRTVVPGN